MAIINELKWQVLTPVVNNMRSPNQALRRFLFPDNTIDPQPTEDIVIDQLTGGRECAPFVRKNGEAILVGGYGTKSTTIAGPNIRIKRPFTPSELLFGRQPGTTPIVTGIGQVMSAVQAHITRDLQWMENLIVNTEELLVAQCLQGVMSYSQDDGDVFTITLPKPAANNITLTTFWNDATPSNVRVLTDIHAVKRVLSEIGFGATDAICGSEAASQLIQLAETGALKFLDQRAVNGGFLDFTRQFDEDGLIYMGQLGGINFWEYSRTATLNGVSQNMVRPKYVEFVNRNADASGRRLYYAAIPDMTAFQGGKCQAKRFSKAWLTEDPSAWNALIHSRPLPWFRRADTTVSVKVISG